MEEQLLGWLGMSMRVVIRLSQEEQAVHNYTERYCSTVAGHKTLITMINAHMRVNTRQALVR